MKINESRILVTQLGEEGVIFDIEKNEYLSLNETFYRIVSGISNGQDREAIVLSLCAEYNIDEADCRLAVDKAIGQLLQKGFIAN